MAEHLTPWSSQEAILIASRLLAWFFVLGDPTGHQDNNSTRKK